MNADMTAWLVSPGVRSSYAEDGALLLDVKRGFSYKLNVLAAQAWVAIEGSPLGISLDGIVDALEGHFQVPRKQLESDTTIWLERLKELGLLRHADGQIQDSSRGDEEIIVRTERHSQSETNRPGPRKDNHHGRKRNHL
jgi:hypothetical protein